MGKDTKSWNPFIGCHFNCVYCYAKNKTLPWRDRMTRNKPTHCPLCNSKMIPHEHPERLNRIPNDKIIWVISLGDIFFCREEYMYEILEAMRNDRKEGRIWLLESKLPACFKKYLSYLPENTWLSTTLETNRDNGYNQISQAPKPSIRYKQFLGLEWSQKILSVEPIMSFDLDVFTEWIVNIKPRCVFVGYNSDKKHKIPEPSIAETEALMRKLESCELEVYSKLIEGYTHRYYKDCFERPKIRLITQNDKPHKDL